MLPAAPLTSHMFRLSHAACCITFRSRGVMRQHTGTTSYAAGRVFGTAVSLPAGLEAARRSMCPGCRVTADLSCPGRACRTAAGGRSGPPAFLHSSLTLHQPLMMVRQGRF